MLAAFKIGSGCTIFSGDAQSCAREGSQGRQTGDFVSSRALLHSNRVSGRISLNASEFYVAKTITRPAP